MAASQKRHFADMTSWDDDIVLTQTTVKPASKVQKVVGGFAGKAKGVVGKAVKKAVKAGFTKQVKAILERQLEKKSIGAPAANPPTAIAIGSAGSNSQAQIYLTPNASTLVIPQGTGAASRIGDRVQVKKVMFRGSLTAGSYDATNNTLPSPMYVKMYFVTYKPSPTSNNNPTSTADFYRSGASTYAMNGAAADPFRVVNPESYTLHGTRLFKIGQAAFVGTPGGDVATGYGANNDFSYSAPFAIDVTKWVPKHIVWNDTTALPTSRALYVIIEATEAAGPTGSASNATAVTMYYDIAFDYVDA